MFLSSWNQHRFMKGGPPAGAKLSDNCLHFSKNHKIKSSSAKTTWKPSQQIIKNRPNENWSFSKIKNIFQTSQEKWKSIKTIAGPLAQRVRSRNRVAWYLLLLKERAPLQGGVWLFLPGGISRPPPAYLLTTKRHSYSSSQKCLPKIDRNYAWFLAPKCFQNYSKSTQKC